MKQRTMKHLFFIITLIFITRFELTAQLVGGALAKELSNSLNATYRGNKETFLARVKTIFTDTSTHFNKMENKFIVDRYIEMLFLQFDKYDLEMIDLAAFARNFQNSPYPELRHWANQKLNVFALMDKPLELKHKSIDGKIIDLKNLRGKVVLVDFWSNTCTVCIERMPFIKSIYEKYKNKGFAVISAANNPEMDKQKIITIHERIGADWPVLLLGGNSKESGRIAHGSIADKMKKEYGFNFVPQLFLLDKQGKLVMYNGLLMQGDFEPLVKDLLEGKTVKVTKEEFDLAAFKAEKDYKGFQHAIQTPFSEAYKTYSDIVKYYTGKEGIFKEGDYKNRLITDSLRMALAEQKYKTATQDYIKNTILWICQHPDALYTPQLIMMWWPKEDLAAAYEELGNRAKNSYYGKELKARISKQ